MPAESEYSPCEELLSFYAENRELKLKWVELAEGDPKALIRMKENWNEHKKFYDEVVDFLPSYKPFRQFIERTLNDRPEHIKDIAENRSRLIDAFKGVNPEFMDTIFILDLMKKYQNELSSLSFPRGSVLEGYTVLAVVLDANRVKLTISKPYKDRVLIKNYGGGYLEVFITGTGLGVNINSTWIEGESSDQIKYYFSAGADNFKKESLDLGSSINFYVGGHQLVKSSGERSAIKFAKKVCPDFIKELKERSGVDGKAL